MSIFFPYSPDVVISTFTTLFSIDLTSLTTYETLIITILANAYFFGFWFFMLYFILKGFNRVYERIF